MQPIILQQQVQQYASTSLLYVTFSPAGPTGPVTPLGPEGP